jgi:hypothetical protein
MAFVTSTNSSAGSLKQRHLCFPPVQRRENLEFLMRPVDEFVAATRESYLVSAASENFAAQ